MSIDAKCAHEHRRELDVFDKIGDAITITKEEIAFLLQAMHDSLNSRLPEEHNDAVGLALTINKVVQQQLEGLVHQVEEMASKHRMLVVIAHPA